MFKAEEEFEKARREKEEISVEVGKLEQAKEKLTQEVTRKTERLHSLKIGRAELLAEGFTPEILKKIREVEKRSGPQLLSQLKTVQEYNQIKQEVSSLRNETAELKREVRTLQIRKKKTEEKLISTKNRLDQLRLQTVTFKESVAVVGSLFASGYSAEDIRSLKHGLDMLGIKGDPYLSVNRLVRGLKKHQSLAAVEEKISAKKQELTAQNKALAKVKRELKVIRQVTLDAIAEAKSAAVEAIADIRTQTSNAARLESRRRRRKKRKRR